MVSRLFGHSSSSGALRVKNEPVPEKVRDVVSYQTEKERVSNYWATLRVSRKAGAQSDPDVALFLQTGQFLFR